MEDLNKKYKEKFDKFYHDEPNLSYVRYNYRTKKIEFMCKKHGLQSKEQYHLFNDRKGCKKCNFEKRTANQTSNTEEFVKKAELISSTNLDDFSLVKYEKNDVLVDIICHKVGKDGKEHGVYKITPNSYLNGSRCPKCHNERTSERQLLPQDKVLKRLKEVYKDRPWYDFSNVVYLGWGDKINIFCHAKDKDGNEHGIFSVIAGHALDRGDGCKKCKYESISRNQSFTTESFVEKAKLIHGDKWIYDETEYKRHDVKCKIKCPKHGVFWQTPSSHLQGSGCPSCSHRKSSGENEITQFLTTKLGENKVFTRKRGIISKMKEIDIYIPSKKIGIEYDGCRWHTEQFGKGKDYHLSKTKICAKSGISLIHVFEDEYIDHKDIVLNKLLHVIGIDYGKRKIYGRKTIIKEIKYDEASAFLDRNHIQGKINATLYIGDFIGDKLVGVITLLNESKGNWVLSRTATDYDYTCCGVIGKMFSYFVKKYSPSYVKSFADRRWTLQNESNLYISLGFTLGDVIEPNYRYVIDGDYKRIHKFNFRKEILSKKYNFPMTMTESDMAEKLNAHKIWDCGLYKYEWRKN